MGGGVSETSVKAHHLGHRERLRERALKGGLEALPDYELLELYLFRTFPRGDVKPLAKALLTRFGSLTAALSASVEELRTVQGIGETAAADLKILHEATLRLARESVQKRPVISSWSGATSASRSPTRPASSSASSSSTRRTSSSPTR